MNINLTQNLQTEQTQNNLIQNNNNIQNLVTVDNINSNVIQNEEINHQNQNENQSNNAQNLFQSVTNKLNLEQDIMRDEVNQIVLSSRHTRPNLLPQISHQDTLNIGLTNVNQLFNSESYVEVNDDELVCAVCRFL